MRALGVSVSGLPSIMPIISTGLPPAAIPFSTPEFACMSYERQNKRQRVTAARSVHHDNKTEDGRIVAFVIYVPSRRVVTDTCPATNVHGCEYVGSTHVYHGLLSRRLAKVNCCTCCSSRKGKRDCPVLDGGRDGTGSHSTTMLQNSCRSRSTTAGTGTGTGVGQLEHHSRIRRCRSPE